MEGTIILKFQLPTIRHDHAGFNALTVLHSQTSKYWFEDIEIDMQETYWFDADMCAPFGAILYGLRDRLNDVHLTNIPGDIDKILSKNGFLSHYGRAKLPDNFGTTISYQRYNVEDGHYFYSYIDREFVNHSEIPNLKNSQKR